jgi:hypothetical protein
LALGLNKGCLSQTRVLKLPKQVVIDDFDRERNKEIDYIQTPAVPDRGKVKMTEDILKKSP